MCIDTSVFVHLYVCVGLYMLNSVARMLLRKYIYMIMSHILYCHL